MKNKIGKSAFYYLTSNSSAHTRTWNTKLSSFLAKKIRKANFNHFLIINVDFFGIRVPRCFENTCPPWQIR